MRLHHRLMRLRVSVLVLIKWISWCSVGSWSFIQASLRWWLSNDRFLLRHCSWLDKLRQLIGKFEGWDLLKYVVFSCKMYPTIQRIWGICEKNREKRETSETSTWKVCRHRQSLEDSWLLNARTRSRLSKTTTKLSPDTKDNKNKNNNSSTRPLLSRSCLRLIWSFHAVACVRCTFQQVYNCINWDQMTHLACVFF